MKPKHLIAVILALVAVAAVSVGLTYRYLKADLSPASRLAPKSQLIAAPLIVTSPPVRRDFSQRVLWIGVVQSQASVRLTALVPGRVEAIEAQDQMPVQKGEMIIRLGGPRIEARRARLQTDIESLKSQLDLAHQTVELIEQSLKERLATKDQVAAAKEAQIKLQAQLHDARMAMESFNKQIHVAAPMSGVFTNRRVSLGQEVSADEVLGEIIDRDHLRIAASLFPPEGIDLMGQEVTIRLGEDRPLTGSVRLVLPQADRIGATMVWIEGPQIDERLRPGQTVSGEVTVGVKTAGLAVKQSAVVYDSEERPYLFVQKDGAYEPVRVKTGLIQDGWVEILSGLEESQSVVTKGAYELFYRRFNEQFKVKD